MLILVPSEMRRLRLHDLVGDGIGASAINMSSSFSVKRPMRRTRPYMSQKDISER
jgi:hypothetical protein